MGRAALSLPAAGRLLGGAAMAGTACLPVIPANVHGTRQDGYFRFLTSRYLRLGGALLCRACLVQSVHVGARREALLFTADSNAQLRLLLRQSDKSTGLEEAWRGLARAPSQTLSPKATLSRPCSQVAVTSQLSPLLPLARGVRGIGNAWGHPKSPI